MALEDYALTTAEAVRRYVKRSGADDSNDDILEPLIDEYSAAIRDYCRREFKPMVDGATRRFSYDGNGRVSLAPYDLRSVTSIVLYSDQAVGYQRTLRSTAPAEYRLDPRNGTREGTFLSLYLPDLAEVNEFNLENISNLSVPPLSFDTEVAITGDWGMPAVPKAVELACKVAVDNRFRNPEGFASRNLGEFGFTEAVFAGPAEEAEGGGALPRAARALLKPYVRKTLRAVTLTSR